MAAVGSSPGCAVVGVDDDVTGIDQGLERGVRGRGFVYSGRFVYSGPRDLRDVVVGRRVVDV